MKTPQWWQQRCLTANACRPMAALWQAGSWLRQRLVTPEHMPVAVICVGNIVAGGGGKTPVALALGEAAKKQGMNAYFLSRGYGGTIQTPTLVDAAIHTAADVGDEPLLLTRVLPTIIAENRVHGAGLAVALGATLIIMDDGLQYPHLHKDVSLLVMKGKKPLGNGLIIPAGPLRETLASALQRSQIIVHIDGENTALPEPVLQNGKPIWKLETTIEIHPAAPNTQNQNPLEARQFVAFAGIAHPEFFRQSLIAAGVTVSAFYGFADHHPYSIRELNVLIQSAADLNVPLITTEKDWVRVAPLLAENKLQPPIFIARQSLALPADALSAVLKNINATR